MERDRGPENVKQVQAKKGANLEILGFCFWMISIFKKITLMADALKFREINQQL